MPTPRAPPGGGTSIKRLLWENIKLSPIRKVISLQHHIKHHSLASVPSQVSNKFDYTRLTCVIGFQGESSLKEAIFANRLCVGLHGMNPTWKSLELK